ncbi:MAG: hypothetical protein WCF85_14790, partial [Rhodospirillaceae bacterium]
MSTLSARQRAGTSALRACERQACLAVLLVLSWLFAFPVRAEGPTSATVPATVKDVQVAVRTIGFLAPPPTGPVELAVVFDPGHPASLADLHIVTTALEAGASAAGVRVGSVPVRVVPLPVAELGRVVNFHYVLLTGGLRAFYSTIAELTRGRGVLIPTAKSLHATAQFREAI